MARASGAGAGLAAFGLRPRRFFPVAASSCLRRLDLGLLPGRGCGRLPLQPLLAFLQAGQPALPVREFRRQFVATPVGTKQTILLLVRGLGLLQPPPNRFLDGGVRPIGGQRRIRLDLRPVQGHQTHLDQSGLGAQPQHLDEQFPQRLLEGLPETSDRRVVRRLVGRDHPVRHVPFAQPLDSAAGPLPHAVAVPKQAHHHRRVMGCVAATILPVPAIELLQVHLAHGVYHEPRQVVSRQPLPQARRHQGHLVPVWAAEMVGHRLTPSSRSLSGWYSLSSALIPDGAGFVRQALISEELISDPLDTEGVLVAFPDLLRGQAVGADALKYL